jgi:hypothetical protein
MAKQASSESTHRQDDLAFGASGLQVGHRLLYFGEREDAVSGTDAARGKSSDDGIRAA